MNIIELRNQMEKDINKKIRRAGYKVDSEELLMSLSCYHQGILSDLICNGYSIGNKIMRCRTITDDGVTHEYNYIVVSKTKLSEIDKEVEAYTNIHVALKEIHS